MLISQKDAIIQVRQPKSWAPRSYYKGETSHLPASCFHKSSNGKGKADIDPTVDGDQVQMGEEASEGQG